MRGWGCVIGVGQSQYQMGKGRWKMRHLASRGEFVPIVLADLDRMASDLLPEPGFGSLMADRKYTRRRFRVWVSGRMSASRG